MKFLQEQAINQYTTIDLDKINHNEEDIKKFSCKKILAQPLQDRDINMDHLCFVDIFAYGKCGMYDSRPFSIIKPAMYIRWILNQSRPYARRNLQYLFSAIHNKEIRAVDSGIFASLRTSKMPSLNAKILKDNVKKNDQKLESNLSTTLGAVPGSKEYWSMKCGDLAVFDEKFGPASVFTTLSCAEYNWDGLYDYLKLMNQDLPKIDTLNFNQLMAIDPVSVSVYFEKKFRTFFKIVIKAKNGPLGEVEHYFWRREYQARGTPHIHMKLWLKNCPIYGVDSDEDVLKWITSHITCRMPDPIKEPRLYYLVMQYQVHKCGPSCQRIVFGGNKKKYIICRYGFPKPVQSQATLNSIHDTLRSRQRGQRCIKLYNLARTYEERWINDYNPVILLLWEANMDIQYIHETSQVLDRYITTYITKSEKNSTEELWETCNKNVSLRSALKSYALKSFKNREMGIYEVADRLHGHALCEFSDQVTWLNVVPKQQRARRLREYKEIEKLNDNDTNIYHNNLIDNYYPNRPDILEDMCLYDFYSWFDYKTTKCIDKHELCETLQNNLGYLHRRTKPKLLKTPKIKPNNPETIQNYFHQILMLFLPWRNEDDDLKLGTDSYQKAFQHAIDNKIINQCLMTEFQDQRAKIETAINKAKELAETTNGNFLPNESEIQHSNDNFNKELLNLGVTDINIAPVNIEQIDKNIHSLNNEQKVLFDKVIQTISHQEAHTNRECKCLVKPKKLKIFCSGLAG